MRFKAETEGAETDYRTRQATDQRAEAEKNLEKAVKKQARDISEMRKQLNLWTRNASAREAHSCSAHQQAKPNLSEISVNHIPDLMQTNAERGRPMFYGALKSHQGASASSQKWHSTLKRMNIHKSRSK
ncbi:hypothetical protein PIB30_064210 [Stylosanthes scabra]|uniref:Uncharacterized protein n=1 Tax=Stylosanthes scabra TaxID=79078 RepID=A0ABU6WK11_9FABA|nr:hypothetical protein [Stylosanthes scabra]